jgi:hypothetical protein
MSRLIPGLVGLGSTLAVAASSCVVVEDPPAGHAGDPDRGEDTVQEVWVEDRCDDGRDIQFTLQAVERDEWWDFYTPGYGLNTSVEIVCEEGELICFGGEAGELKWGVGLDGYDSSDDCDWCCFDCFADTVDLGYLTCPP